MNLQTPIVSTLVEPELESRERRARLLWTGGIVVFFVIQAIIWIIALYITNNDLSHAILPRYDERALAWDQEAATIQHSRDLGWQLELTVAVDSDWKGARDVTVQLRDKQGLAITDAKLEANFFHQARAALRETATFLPLSDSEPQSGLYRAHLALNRSGIWRFEFVVQRGPDTFVKTVQTMVEVKK